MDTSWTTTMMQIFFFIISIPQKCWQGTDFAGAESTLRFSWQISLSKIFVYTVSKLIISLWLQSTSYQFVYEWSLSWLLQNAGLQIISWCPLPANNVVQGVRIGSQLHTLLNAWWPCCHTWHPVKHPMKINRAAAATERGNKIWGFWRIILNDHFF